MRCQRCGAQIGNSYVRFNGTLLCDSCARELKIDEVIRRQSAMLDQAFPSLGEIPGVFSLGSDLDFANAKIRCQRCGTTLRDIESGGQLGCIECYNTFNETVLKNILKRQGSSEYLGRKPGVAADIKSDDGSAVKESGQDAHKPSYKKDLSGAANSEAAPAAKAEASNESAGKNIIERLKTENIGSISAEDLKAGLNYAVAAENYEIAAKIRDELNARQGGQ